MINFPFSRRLIGFIFSYLMASHLCYGQSSGLFDSGEILEISLKGDIKRLFSNTKGEAVYFDFNLESGEDTENFLSIPLRIRTRGHFRREMNICDYPPLLLNFSKKNTKNTIFSGQDKVKLVLPCRGERYVMREYLAYRIYNQLTPNSFKVRPVRVFVSDHINSGINYDPVMGFLIEDEEQLAGRIQMDLLELDLIQPEAIAKEDFLRMAVFQYMIGNTDWSIQYRQNIKLLSSNESGRPIAVPYDFDHAGIVRAPYANPAPELKLSSVTERRYRGYCLGEMEKFEKTFEEFFDQKEAIYSLISKTELMDLKSIKATIKFFDAFYFTIANPKRAKFDFQYPCQGNGTGNVVIKGLK